MKFKIRRNFKNKYVSPGVSIKEKSISYYKANSTPYNITKTTSNNIKPNVYYIKPKTYFAWRSPISFSLEDYYLVIDIRVPWHRKATEESIQESIKDFLKIYGDPHGSSNNTRNER